MPDWDSPFSSALETFAAGVAKVFLLWLLLSFFASSILLTDLITGMALGGLFAPYDLMEVIFASGNFVIGSWFFAAFSCWATPLAMAQVILIGLALIIPERTKAYFLWIVGIQAVLSYVAACWGYGMVSPLVGLVIFPFTATWVGIGWAGLRWWGKKQLGEDFEARRDEMRMEAEALRPKDQPLPSYNDPGIEWDDPTERSPD